MECLYLAEFGGSSGVPYECTEGVTAALVSRMPFHGNNGYANASHCYVIVHCVAIKPRPHLRTLYADTCPRTTLGNVC
jgi:hypothetical protein